MKKFISILLALVAFVTFQSCVEDNTDDGFSAKVVTLDATDITSDSFTFHATIDYSGGAACVGEGGIFFSSLPNVTETQSRFTSETIMLKNGTNKVDKTVINLMTGGVYFFQPEKTVYYCAYAKVFTPGNGDEFVYGDVKSFVVPKKD